MDPYGNFAYGVVTAPPSPGVSGLSMTVSGSHWPATPFNATVRPAGADQGTVSTAAEIVRVTANAAGVFTIQRAAEGPNAARTIVAGDIVTAGVTAKTLNDILGGGPFTALNINPAASSLGTGLVANQTAHGVYSGVSQFNYDLNGIYINSDDVDTTNHGIYGFHIHHNFGGSSANGQRLTFMSWLHQTAATSPTGTDTLRYYIPLQATIQTDTGDGGTNTGAGSKGYYFAQNNVLLIDAANCSQFCGIEVDINASSGSSSRYVMGMSICSGHVNRGVDIDAAIDIHSVGASGGGGGPAYGPGGGFRHGFCLVSLGGLVPLSSDGTVVGSYIQSGFGVTTIPAAYGIDLNDFTFSQQAFRSTYFQVAGATVPGNVHIGAGSPATGGRALNVQLNDNTEFANVGIYDEFGVRGIGFGYIGSAFAAVPARQNHAEITTQGARPIYIRPGDDDTHIVEIDTSGSIYASGLCRANGGFWKRETTIASSATPTPVVDTTDIFTVTALAANATFGAPTGTTWQGMPLTIRVKDNGTARTLAWNAIYRASPDLPLPTTTVVNKTMYLQFIYNATDSKWDFVSLLNNF